MSWLEAVLVALLILFIFYFGCKYLKYDTFNTTAIKSSLDNKHYNVHLVHTDHQQAADLMAEISRRIGILTAHLKEKYIYGDNQTDGDMNREKNNRIDVIPASDDINDARFRVRRLLEKYNPENMVENSPLNLENNTSYTEGKGRKIAVCLRRKDGKYGFHNINTLMFVILHELSHVMNTKYGHGREFWPLFKWLLVEAVEAGVYEPQDFRRRPILYCGLMLTYSPLYS